MKKYIRYISIPILMAFGLLTLFLSSSVIFDCFGIRAKEGHYVLFVVWANFFASLLYLSAAFAFLKKRKWTMHLLLLAALILISAFIALQIYIANGGIHESKTVLALIFRSSLTLLFAASAYFSINKNQSQ